MRKSIHLLLLLSCCLDGLAQYNPVFDRMRGISNDGVFFYNIEGIEITSQPLEGEFSKKSIAKKFRKYSIKESDLEGSDSAITNRNFYVVKSAELTPGVIQNTSYYFLQTGTGNKAITFGSINKMDTALQREIVRLIVADSISPGVLESMDISTVNFAGRYIELGGSCRWMGVNNVQCPWNGQMNWSVHRTLEDAAASVSNQFKVIEAKKQGKIISEEEVTVIFEGTEVKARRVIYDFKGVTSVLAGMSGGKTLTIYFVAAPVRRHFVSCVMSFWNNDRVNASGLPALLEEVMILQDLPK